MKLSYFTGRDGNALYINRDSIGLLRRPFEYECDDPGDHTVIFIGEGIHVIVRGALGQVVRILDGEETHSA